jgi:hypothetical protein
MEGLTANIYTQVDFANNNDEGSISIHRLAIYRSDGTIACEGEIKSLEPHQVGHYNTGRFIQCPAWLPEPNPGTASLSLIAYWSYGNPYVQFRNPLVGVSKVIFTHSSGAVSATSFECKPVTLRR